MLGGFFAFFRGLCRNCAQDINVILFHQNFGHSDVQQLEDRYILALFPKNAEKNHFRHSSKQKNICEVEFPPNRGQLRCESLQIFKHRS
jgi:hypothetical protein